MTRNLTPLEEARQNLDRTRPTVTATMLAALDLGERLFMEGRQDDAVAILGALQALQSENIQLVSALELTAMAAEHEQRRLLLKMEEEKQARYEGGYAIAPWTTYVDLQEIANSWARKKADGDAQRADASLHKRPKNKHAKKKKKLPKFISDHTKKLGVSGRNGRKDWACRIISGESSITLNALAISFRDHLISEGFKPEEIPADSTLRNWIKDYLSAL